MKRFITALVLLVSAYPTYAAQLKAPIGLTSAQVLPKNIRNLRYNSIFIEGNEKYTNTGVEAPLADPFFKNLTWNDVLDFKGDAIKKGLLKGYLEANGFDLDAVVGSTNGDISGSATAHVPVFAYGLTEKLTLAIAVPIIKYESLVGVGFVPTSEIDRINRSFEDNENIASQTEFNDRMSDPINFRLDTFNYAPLKNEKGTLLGDIKVVGKYNILKNDNVNFTLQPEVTLPTGKIQNANEVVAPARGDGQWDVGLSLLTDYTLTSELTLNTALTYVVQLPDEKDMRVPYKSDSKLSNDQESLERDLGDSVSAQLGIRYEFFKGTTFRSGYSFQYKGEDKYDGGQFEAARYDLLSDDTRQRMHSIQLGLGYSTIKLFREGSFPVPLEVSVIHSRVLSGKNVTKDPQTTLSMAMFF